MGLLKYKLRDGWHVLYGGILQKILRKDMNLSDVDNVAAARSNLGLTGNVTTHYHQVYVDSIAGLQEDIDVLDNAKQDLYNRYTALSARLEAAEQRVTTLENVVGDSTKGLVKIVGNNNSGLVKDVNDLKAQVSTNTSDIATLKNTVGDSTKGLVKRVTDLENALNGQAGIVARVQALENLPKIYISDNAPTGNDIQDLKSVWIDKTSGEESIQIKVSNSWKKVGAFWK